jgi:hypothetical protein
MEHLEFNHCEVISSKQFEGHVVHKLLITELLKGGEAWERFQQKTAKYEATIDHEEEGGVSLGDDPLGEDYEVEDVKFEALKPDEPADSPMFAEPYPPLPAGSKTASDTGSVNSAFGGLSLVSNSQASTAVGSPVSATFPGQNSISSRSGSTIQDSRAPSSTHQPKVWGSRNGKSASNVLFPDAKPTPAPSEFSIVAYDEAVDKANRPNIMRSRFWDPMSTDFNAEKFYNTVTGEYNCPFVCE